MRCSPAVMAQDPSIRVTILSATNDVQLRVACLEQAGRLPDQPFAVRELTGRVRNRLLENGTNRRKEILVVGDIVLDLQGRQLLVDGQPIVLSQREFLSLQHLMRNADVVCFRQELLSALRGRRDVLGVPHDVLLGGHMHGGLPVGIRLVATPRAGSGRDRRPDD